MAAAAAAPASTESGKTAKTPLETILTSENAKEGIDGPQFLPFQLCI